MFLLIGCIPFGMLMKGRQKAPESYRFGFGGHEKIDEVKGSGNWYAFGDYGYDSRLGRRPGLDPVDQIGISNYAVFGNNPIFFIDPDGREKIKSLGPDDKTIESSADNFIKHENAIHIWAHGTDDGKGLVTYKKEMEGDKEIWKKEVIRDAEKFKEFLSENSTDWQNRKEGEKMTIVLHSCNTGKGGENSFAAKMSKDLENTTVIAPTKLLNVQGFQNGTYTEKVQEKSKTVQYYWFTKPDPYPIKGEWAEYRKGKSVGNYPYDWVPEIKPKNNITKK